MGMLKLSSTGMKVLSALISATNGSVKAHVPAPAVLCKFKKDKRGLMKKELLKIAKLGLATKHPTKGEVTWQLTRHGAIVARNIDQEYTDDA